MSTAHAYVGTYADPQYGIPQIELDLASGALRLLRVHRGLPQKPSYLCMSPDRSLLYAGGELSGPAANTGGVLAALAVSDDQLTLLNTVPVFAGSPCHLAIDWDSRLIFAANYHAGTGVVYPLQPDGTPAPSPFRFAHHGQGPHPTRQEAAHVHCVAPLPGSRLLYVVDLGLDRVKVYRYGIGQPTLEAVPEADLATAPGAGPRHLIFSGDCRFAYLIHELDSTVAVWDIARPTAPRHLQTLPLLPDSFPGKNTAAAIKLSADGSRLFCSNRGDDSLAVFARNASDGTLRRLAISPTLGRGPRDFALAPGGRFVVTAHQYTDTLVCQEFDWESGRLHGVPRSVLTLSQQPVCVLFA